MAINNTLRQLRIESGLTQEQVAEKLNVTRQTVSSYESGRTRPDIDTLMRLSEIYGTDLEGIVYGNAKNLKALRNVRIVGFTVLAVTAILVLVSSALRCASNYFFPLLNDPTLQYLDQHFRTSNAADLIEGLSLTISFWGILVTLFFILVPKCKIQIKQKLLYIIIFVALLFAVSLPFAIADPVFGNINFTLTPIRISMRLVLFLIIDIIVEAVMDKRSK